jgi:hypothetical protein
MVCALIPDLCGNLARRFPDDAPGAYNISYQSLRLHQRGTMKKIQYDVVRGSNYNLSLSAVRRKVRLEHQWSSSGGPHAFSSKQEQTAGFGL